MGQKRTRKQMLADILTDIAEEEREPEEKLQMLGPLLALCDQELPEVRFRAWLHLMGVEFEEPEVFELVKKYASLLAGSGIISITDRFEENSVIDSEDIEYFRGMVDEELQHLREIIEEDKQMFASLLDLAD